MYNKKLANGIEIPPILFGTWNLPNGATCTDLVTEAIRNGYRGFDTAYSYGNDFFVGKAIKKSEISRESLFVTNKLWKTFYGKDEAIEACKKSLKLMKLDYFDLYLIHWPVSNLQDDWREMNYSTWLGMESLYKEGLVKVIGVSNFYLHHLQALLEMKPKVLPMVNQIEFHPGFYHRETYDYCIANGIMIQGWSPLGNGGLMNHPEIIEISRKYDKTVAQICLRYSIQKDVIPIPRTSNYERAIENLDVFNFEISNDDMIKLQDISPNFASGFNPDTNQPR